MRRVIYSTTAADYMLQEERDAADFRVPCKIEDLPQEASFREFAWEVFGTGVDDLTDEDYDSLRAKYDHYYDGWDLKPEFKH